MIKKQHDPCVLFLEDVFGQSHADRLLAAGYYGVERFADHFRDERTNTVAQRVKDSPIIRKCDAKNWLLVTPDKEMQFTHVEQIKRTNIAILATAHNNAADVAEWVDALIKGKARVERYFKKCARPCFATINRQGNITKPRLIAPTCTTRRVRPQEMEPASSNSTEEEAAS